MAVAGDAVIDEQGAELGDIVRARRQRRAGRPLRPGDVPGPHDSGTMSVLAWQVSNRDPLIWQLLRQSDGVRQARRLEDPGAQRRVPGLARQDFDNAPRDRHAGVRIPKPLPRRKDLRQRPQ